MLASLFICLKKIYHSIYHLSFYFIPAECPKGTKEEGGECVACPLGTYNNIAGSTSCIECPQGSDTLAKGQKDITGCRCKNRLQINHLFCLSALNHTMKNQKNFFYICLFCS